MDMWFTRVMLKETDLDDIAKVRTINVRCGIVTTRLRYKVGFDRVVSLEDSLGFLSGGMLQRLHVAISTRARMSPNTVRNP